MKAIEISEWTAPQHLMVREVAAPECGPLEVLIRVSAAAVSYSLSLLIAGRYQRKPVLPFIPGNTVAGTVIALGKRTSGIRLGERVLASLEFGALAELAVAHQDNVYPIPDNLPFAEATTFNSAYNSVAAALTWPHLLAINAGQSLLLTGAAGGIGTAAIQLGRALGATVIAAASTPEKRRHALEQGAHGVVESNPATLRDAVLQANSGRPVNCAIDSVGGNMFEQALRCLAPEGRILPIGFASGEIPKVAANLLLVKNLTVCGLYMGYYKIDARAENVNRMKKLFEQLGQWWQSGSIRPVIAGRYALEEVPAAFAQALDRSNIGAVVIEMDSSPR